MKPLGRWWIFQSAIVSFFLLAGTSGGWAYPLDGDRLTGIGRLEGYRLVQEGKIRGLRLPPGALLKTDQVNPRLLDSGDMDLPEADPEFNAQVRGLLGADGDRYGLAVLDLSDRGAPRYAEIEGSKNFNPGSVGKLMVALAVFQALADLYPDDPESRIRVLRETMVTADAFIRFDHHEVPIWNRQAHKMSYRPLQLGDSANLWTYLDWMLSASCNAAASMVLKQLILMTHFGRRYPVSREEGESFLQKTPKAELSALFARVLQDPVRRNGLDLVHLRQGGFFTTEGNRRVPGTSSHASARGLMRYLLRLEQGRLVDVFSSREIKRLLYMTQRRIRYASSPALAKAAVYFKSGSLYKCRPEPGFRCRKYQGNEVNWMNSVAIVESPAEAPRLFYMAVVMSNVLRKNSAVEHQTLATRLHRLIESRHETGRSGAQPIRGEK
jgi:hypothetical protein